MAEYGYDSPLEFPGFDPDSAFTGNNDPNAVTERDPFRLVVLDSPVVPSKRNIANISEHAEVSIGRDIPSDPDAARLRLREMAVYKYHAIVFWDLERNAWGLVDVGSVHGTFVQSYGSSTLQRLSSAKVASHPGLLRHLDVVQIGGSTMSCHLHTRDNPNCEGCTLTASNALSLLHQHKAPKPSATFIETNGTSTHPFGLPQDARASLSKLKSQLLLHEYRRDNVIDAPLITYIDRAASRRMHLGTSTPPAEVPPPEVTKPGPSRARATYERAAYERAAHPNVGPMNHSLQVNMPPRHPEIPTSNRGHRLLRMQGWKPGIGLGVDSAGVMEPLFIKPVSCRAGIGSGVDEEMR